MKLDKEYTRVIFRAWKINREVLALFPDLEEHSPGFVSSYQHFGQHSPADYGYCIMRTRPAKPQEYAALARELRQIGYRLKIMKRRPNRKG